MNTMTLPVIIIKNAVLLPYNEFKIDASSSLHKVVLETSEKFYDNHLLVVNVKTDSDNNELPKVGVMCQIKTKIILPNGKIRIIISALNRVSIEEYLEPIDDNRMEASIKSMEKPSVDPKEEIAYSRILLDKYRKYLASLSSFNNKAINSLSTLSNLDKITDIIAFNLILTFDRKVEYLNEVNTLNRVTMLLSDIKQEEEIQKLEEDIETDLKDSLDKSQKEYILREKMKVIKNELGEVNAREEDIERLNKKLKKLKAPKKVKEKIADEIKKYEMVNPASPETSILRNYIDTMLKLPWSTYSKDQVDLDSIKKTLDKSHYGLEKIKTRIFEYIAVKQFSNNTKTPIICFTGPPGVGKTTFAKSIAEALNRNFVKITVGGVTDEAELVGHRRTYMGSKPGRIIENLKKCGTSNPVFLIDEIDKMGKDFKGDPSSILLEVLDYEQNKHFSDNYIEEEYNLSRVMFITTANYIHQIPEALRDRLEIIELNSYTELEKVDIANNYLIKKLLKEYKLKPENIEIMEDALIEIINYYTKESGVRELTRKLETIFRKVVTEMCVGSSKKRKYIIRKRNVVDYLDKRIYSYSNIEKIDNIGVVNGLAYTPYGGDITQIEVNLYKGKGNFKLTGMLGKVMEESVSIAMTYIKSNSVEFDIDEVMFNDYDIHIHFPEGAIRKDGPSAGTAITTALISAFSNKKVSHKVAMTGEITLRGNVLPIGGLKEKAIGAYRNNIKTIFIPFENVKDLDEISDEIKDDIEFIPVKKYDEIYDILLKFKKTKKVEILSVE